jgi:hypothetical protein
MGTLRFKLSHGGRGYDLYWLGRPETGTFRRDLASFRFTG